MGKAEEGMLALRSGDILVPGRSPGSYGPARPVPATGMSLLLIEGRPPRGGRNACPKVLGHWFARRQSR